MCAVKTGSPKRGEDVNHINLAELDPVLKGVNLTIQWVVGSG